MPAARPTVKSAFKRPRLFTKQDDDSIHQRIYELSDALCSQERDADLEDTGSGEHGSAESRFEEAEEAERNREPRVLEAVETHAVDIV